MCVLTPKGWYLLITTRFLFLDTFDYRKCLETGEMTKSFENYNFSRDLVIFPVSRHIPYSKNLVVSIILDTFRNQKCLETVKRQNPLKYSKNVVKSPVSGHLPYSKVQKE